jgi:Protein of unknown function (DUF1571)
MAKATESAKSVRWLVIAVVFLGPGCSGLSGLRSVGTGKPPLFGFWDRSGTASPSPENDFYTQQMHDSGFPAGTPAQKDTGAQKDKPQGPLVTVDDDVATTGRERIADASENNQARRGTPSTKPGPGGSVRVTLGRPEPLPGMVLAANVPEEPTEPSAALAWKKGGTRTEVASGPGPGGPKDEDAGPNGLAAPVAAPETRQPAGDAKIILTQAETRLKSLNSYQVKFSRAERVGGQLQPEEDIILSVQRTPKAIRLEWTSGASKGREVIYSSDLDPRMIFVHLPTTGIALPAMRIAVDSPLVMKNSRHAITEAGFDTIVANLRSADGGNDRNQKDGGMLQYKGLEPPPGSIEPAHHFVRRARNGETWNVYFDARSMLPTLVQAVDSQGALVERYLYREVRENPTELASAGAFEPEKRWGESRNILSRIARAASGANLPSSSDSTTR